MPHIDWNVVSAFALAVATIALVIVTALARADSQDGTDKLFQEQDRMIGIVETNAKAMKRSQPILLGFLAVTFVLVVSSELRRWRRPR